MKQEEKQLIEERLGRLFERSADRNCNFSGADVMSKDKFVSLTSELVCSITDGLTEKHETELLGLKLQLTESRLEASELREMVRTGYEG